MGGYGALTYSLKYPDLFAAAGALSAAVRSDDQIINLSEDEWRNTFGQLYGRDLKGGDRLTKTWYDNSVLKLVETKSLDDLKKVRYWIDCGDDDYLTIGNCLLQIALIEKKSSS